MIKLESVNKTYKSKKGTPCKALIDVNLQLGSSGMYFILGKSGSGKSTLLNILGGLDRADSGKFIFKGENVFSLSERELEKFRNNEIGFIFQDYNLLDDFDVFENVGLALELQGEKSKEEIKNKVLSALEIVGLQGYEARKINELSGGQKQRVSIARAIVKNSSLILADEPTGNLDSETGEEIFDILKKLSKDKLVIVVSHDKENAETYGDGIINIKDGETNNENFGENNKIEKNERNTNIKIPFRYSLKIAFKNIMQKKFKVVLTVLSMVLMLVFTSGMYAFYDFDCERAIAKTFIKDNQSVYGLSDSNENSFGNYNFFNTITNFKSDEYLSSKNLTYFKAFDLNDRFNFELHRVEGGGYSNYEVISKAVLIESESDILTLGYSLYDNSSFIEGGIYLSDITIFAMFRKGYEFVDKTTDYNQMAGKIIKLSGNEYLISGVIKTDYINDFYVNENRPTTVYTNAEYNIIQRDYLKNFSNNAFMSEKTYLDKFSYSQVELLANGKISNNNFDFILTSGVNSSILEKSDIKTNNGINSISDYLITKEGNFSNAQLTLNKNEIFVSVAVYNSLFPENKIEVDYETFDENAVYNLTNLDNELNFELKQKTADKNFLNLDGGVKIKGIMVPYDNSKEITVNPILLNSIDKEINLYTNRVLTILVSNDEKVLEQTLRDLKNDYSIGLINEPAKVFYSSEVLMKEFALVFLVLLVASLFATVILLLNLISLGVGARTKEIGIFKALGTGNGELSKAYLIETLIISAISFILGVILSNVFINFANTAIELDYSNIMNLIFFVQMPLSYIIMAVQTFIVMPLFALVPLRKISKMTPIDAIKK